ncbi:MAG: Holliday junction branch migration protein RuvA [Actinomycetaceae bacterium]|nr:Holliday junction branch migration protein RuvA [Actinomycetaceae bacterium]
MIALIQGRVHHIGADKVIVTTTGVGYLIHTNSRTLMQLRHGEDVELHTAMVVREDSLTLYGFLSSDERDTHNALQSVTGVGPRTALAALEVFTPDELRQALANEDEKALQRIPGVGKKSAQRLIINIGDKLGPPSAAMPVKPTVDDTTGKEVVAALVSLGWNSARAEEAVAQFAGSGMNTSDMLRAALIALGGNHG